MFENYGSIGGSLHIEDDDLRMTREQLINGFSVENQHQIEAAHTAHNCVNHNRTACLK